MSENAFLTGFTHFFASLFNLDTVDVSLLFKDRILKN